MTVAVLEREQNRPPAPPNGGKWRKPRSIEVGPEPQRLLDKDDRRMGAFVQNLGGQLELQLQLPKASKQIGSPLPLSGFLLSEGIAVPTIAASSFKSFVIMVDSDITWVGAGQSKIQVVAGRQPWGASNGGVSQFGPGGGQLNQNFGRGAAVNWGGAGATSIVAGAYGFDATDLANLQWPWPYIGVQLQPFATLTGGSARLFLELSGGPNLMLGRDRNMAPDVGDMANAWPLIAASAPFWVPTKGELWAASGPGIGSVDCRVWEVYAGDDADADGTAYS